MEATVPKRSTAAELHRQQHEGTPTRRRRGWNIGAPVAIAGAKRTVYAAGDPRRAGAAEVAAEAEGPIPETIFHSSGAVFSTRRAPDAPSRGRRSIGMRASGKQAPAAMGSLVASPPGRFSSCDYMQDRSPSLWIPCVYHPVAGAVQWNLNLLDEDGHVSLPGGALKAVYQAGTGRLYAGPAVEHIWGHYRASSGAVLDPPRANAWKISYSSVSTGAASWDSDGEDINTASLLWPFFIAPSDSGETAWTIPSAPNVNTPPLVVNAWGVEVSSSSPPHFCGKLDVDDISTGLLTPIEVYRNCRVARYAPTAKVISETVASASSTKPNRTSDDLGRQKVSVTTKLAQPHSVVRTVTLTTATVDVPASCRKYFSSLLKFCNSFCVEKAPPKSNKSRGAYAVSNDWVDVISQHLAVIGGVVTLTDSTNEKVKTEPMSLPLPPFHRKTMPPNSASSIKDPLLPHKDGWRQACSPGKPRRWSVVRALTLVLYDDQVEDGSKGSIGLIDILVGFFSLSDPLIEKPLVEVKIKCGMLLIGFFSEMLSLYAKRSTVEQRRCSELLHTYFTESEGKKNIKYISIKSVLTPQVLFNYADVVSETPSASTTECDRLLSWWRSASTAVQRLGNFVLEAEESCCHQCLSTGDISPEASRKISTSAAVELLSMTCTVLQYLSVWTFSICMQDDGKAVNRADFEQKINIVKGFLGAVEISDSPQHEIPAPLTSRSIPSRSMRQSTTSKDYQKRPSVKPVNGRPQKSSSLRPTDSTEKYLNTTPLLVGTDVRYSIAVDLIALTSLHYLPDFSAENDLNDVAEVTPLISVWTKHFIDLLPSFVYSFLFELLARKIRYSADHHLLQSRQFLITCVEEAGRRVEQIKPGSPYRPLFVLFMLKHHWLQTCRSHFDRFASRCPYIVYLNGFMLEEGPEIGSCKCSSDGTASLSIFHETVALLVSVSAINRELNTLAADHGSIRELSLVVALEMHCLNSVWKILSSSIYEYCQNLIDWPVDTFVQVVDMISTLNMCLENTLKFRSAVDGHNADFEDNVLCALEILVEEIVAMHKDIKNSVEVAKRNDILTGEHCRGCSLYKCLVCYPFDISVRNLVHILSGCYDET